MKKREMDHEREEGNEGGKETFSEKDKERIRMGRRGKRRVAEKDKNGREIAK